MLAEMLEHLKKSGLPDVPPDHCYAGPGDVACDSCTGRKQKAVKTCLQCRVSYCDVHLQPHYQSPAFKKHELVEASGELQEIICSRHDEKELDMSHQNIQQRLQEREKDVKMLHQEVESMNHDRAVENIDATLSRAEDLRRRVEKEVTELRRRRAESHKEHHIHFPQRFTSLPAAGESIQPVSSNVEDVVLEMIIKGVTAFFSAIYFMFVIFYYSAISFLAFLSFFFSCAWLMMVLDVDIDAEVNVQVLVAASCIGVSVFIMCYKSGPAWDRRSQKMQSQKKISTISLV